MDEKAILADLKERFQGRIYLTIADIAELYGTTPMAQYHKRHRGQWPFGDFVDTEGSGQILVSVYKVAEVVWLEMERASRKKAPSKTPPSASDKAPATSRKRLTFKQAARVIALARAEALELEAQAEAMKQIAKALEDFAKKDQGD